MGGGVADTVRSVSWSPDGQYLAVGGAIAGNTNFDLFVYRFDRINETLTQVTALNPDGGGVADTVRSVSWSPDGQYLAVAGAISGTTNFDLFVYRFERSSETLTQVAAVNPGSSFDIDTVFAIAWSPDGRYLAVGGFLYSTSGSQLFIYRFNRSTETLTEVASAAGLFEAVAALSWSPDGRYLAAGLDSRYSAANALVVYRFDNGTEMLTQMGAANPDSGASTDRVDAVSWSPDGRYLAVGGLIQGVTGFDLFIYQAFNFPSDNVITNNTVYCNSGGSGRGVGISASSICNLVIQNTAYSNPINPTIVSSNYQFVCNVYNQLFNSAPTLMQNISLGTCEPIAIQDDASLLIKQTKAFLGTKIDNLSTQVSLGDALILSAIAGPCAATSITTNTTINASGFYCLANDSVTSIVINASNVTLDLNNHIVNGSIAVNGNDATISNGVVSGTTSADAITATSVSNLTVSRVRAESARRGIFLNSVAGGVISNCEMVRNTTGLELQQSYDVAVENSIARRNTQSGFSLVLSNTNCFTECKALSTGENNTNMFANNVYGFVSQNGFSNVFENCIANATQALSTTDYNSYIAGFALTGTESCSKIIDCEASNAVTSASGVTVPYGIYLQATMSGLNTVTVVNPGGGASTDIVRSVAWSPDGIYLAIGGNLTGSDLYVYRFDRVTNNLEQVVAVTPSSISNDLNVVTWSPDGQYLAIAFKSGNHFINVYRFDRAAQTLTLVAFYIGEGLSGQFLTLSWSPDGNYIGGGGSIYSGSGFDIRILRFDRVAQTLNEIVRTNPGGGGVADSVSSSMWSPDGAYFAVGASLEGVTPASRLIIYSFNSAIPSLTSVVEATQGTAGGVLRGLSWSWSPDGRYIATGGSIDAGANDLYVYRFDRTPPTLTFITSLNPGDGSTDDVVYAVTWSPDGRYLAVGGQINPTSGGTEDILIYTFDPGSRTLTQVTSTNSGGGSSSNIVYALGWSPDGRYLAAGGDIQNNVDLFLYTGLSFPSDNVITNNTVYCNSGGGGGVGISASSICNLVIQNTAYSNPINPSIVSSNYQFVCNVFNQLFGNEPTMLQNIALGTCEPITIPDDCGLLQKQTLARIGMLTDTGTFFATTVDQTVIDNLQLDVVQLLKSILIKLYH